MIKSDATRCKNPNSLTEASAIAMMPGSPPADINSILDKIGQIEMRLLATLLCSGKQLRKLTTKKIIRLAASMQAYEIFMPILITFEGEIIAGEARVEAAKVLGLERVPCLIAHHLTAGQVRAYRIADNKLAEGEWDRHQLALELEAIIELGEVTIDTIGFETGEIDVLVGELANAPEGAPDPVDVIPERQPAISVAGDLWLLGKHRLICGSSRDQDTVGMLMNGRLADMVMTDPPYNTLVNGHVSGSGKHPEFYEASGEMSRPEFISFLTKSVGMAASVAKDGAVLDVFMDAKHLPELFAAVDECGLQILNLCVWDKGSGGMGSLYRSQAEFALILKKGKGPHTNCVELGRHGRYRTTIWSCPGANSFGKTRTQDLADHPTVKPVRLIADAIRDVSRPGELVFDGFMGSGTTICAAERTNRIGYGVEIDPVYIDVAIRRWQEMTNSDAVLAATGETFVEVKARREAAANGESEPVNAGRIPGQWGGVKAGHC